jgi:hypothetical protein
MFSFLRFTSREKKRTDFCADKQRRLKSGRFKQKFPLKQAAKAAANTGTQPGAS